MELAENGETELTNELFFAHLLDRELYPEVKFVLEELSKEYKLAVNLKCNAIWTGF
jgi:putative hydrolase of the HAD superfamily